MNGYGPIECYVLGWSASFALPLSFVFLRLVVRELKVPDFMRKV
jgi:hypothetical protein